jgi:hypothetical protein
VLQIRNRDGKNPDPGVTIFGFKNTSVIFQSVLLIRDLGGKNLDPGSGMEKFRSGMNIPDCLFIIIPMRSQEKEIRCLSSYYGET